MSADFAPICAQNVPPYPFANNANLIPELPTFTKAQLLSVYKIAYLDFTRILRLTNANPVTRRVIIFYYYFPRCDLCEHCHKLFVLLKWVLFNIIVVCRSLVLPERVVRGREYQ